MTDNSEEARREAARMAKLATAKERREDLFTATSNMCLTPPRSVEWYRRKIMVGIAVDRLLWATRDAMSECPPPFQPPPAAWVRPKPEHSKATRSQSLPRNVKLIKD